MALTEAHNDQRRLMVVGTVLMLIVAAIAVTYWRSLPPQMGADEEAFKTVDALFTALTCRSQKQLNECDQRLTDYLEAGTLPKDAADFLDSVILQARSGNWEPAARRLYDFMYRQRRQ